MKPTILKHLLTFLSLCLCLSFLASVAAAAAQTSAETPDRPNVIVILADDLGYGDRACYGHPKFKTPGLDRMAAEGARLTHFNTPMPFCAPTRASLLTGRYPFRCGMNGNPAPDGVTILAPYEQYPPSAYPGKIAGEPSRPMQLFDLESDPSEQTDVAAEHPDVVARLKRLYDEMLPDAG